MNERFSLTCASVILQWHLQHGLASWPSGPYVSSDSAYRAALAHYRNADLTLPSSRLELARAQRSGDFEVHAGAEIPAVLWERYAEPSVSNEAIPGNLYQAAGFILEIDGELPNVKVPDEEVERSPSSQDALLERAALSYSHVERVGRNGTLGGVAGLLSSSLERQDRTTDHSDVVLMTPDQLGLVVIDTMKPQYADDLRTLVLAGAVHISNVIGTLERT